MASQKHIPAVNIQSIEVVKGKATTQGASAVVNYTIKVFTRDGKKVTVAEMIPGAAAAEEITGQIKAACNLRR